MKRNVLLFSLVVPMLAFAQAKVVDPTKAPVIAANYKLACGSGTAQVGGAGSSMQMLGCMKVGVEGQRIFEGPMLSFYKDGKVEAQGQTEAGFRSGKWSFFNEAGQKVGETEFKRGDYHGRRAIFGADGQLKAEEFWVEGKRQGPQKTFDAAGKMTVVNFLDDRPSAN